MIPGIIPVPEISELRLKSQAWAVDGRGGGRQMNRAVPGLGDRLRPVPCQLLRPAGERARKAKTSASSAGLTSFSSPSGIKDFPEAIISSRSVRRIVSV